MLFLSDDQMLTRDEQIILGVLLSVFLVLFLILIIYGSVRYVMWFKYILKHYGLVSRTGISLNQD